MPSTNPLIGGVFLHRLAITNENALAIYLKICERKISSEKKNKKEKKNPENYLPFFRSRCRCLMLPLPLPDVVVAVSRRCLSVVIPHPQIHRIFSEWNYAFPLSPIWLSKNPKATTTPTDERI